jgi:DNA-directed RNA polymerase subunit RPC12/RpoP
VNKIKPFKYADLIGRKTVPEGYVCSDCDATNGRLFLMYENFVRKDRLTCAACVERLLSIERFTGATAAYPAEDGAFFYTSNEYTKISMDWWNKLPLYAKPPPTRLPRKLKKKIKAAVVYHRNVRYPTPVECRSKDVRVKMSKYGMRFLWVTDPERETQPVSERDRYGFAAGLVREVAFDKYVKRIRTYLRSVHKLPPMAREYLPNLAGKPTETANTIVIEELTQAGIEVCDYVPTGEVPTTKYGLLRVGGYVIGLSRAWVYWVAEVAEVPDKNKYPALSAELSRKLNDSLGTADGTKYSGNLKKLGGVVRAEGFAGGRETHEIDRPVNTWHIDSPAGLILFTRWCNANLTDIEPTSFNLDVPEKIEVHAYPTGHAGKMKTNTLTVFGRTERDGTTVYRVKLNEGDLFNLNLEQMTRVVRGGEFVEADGWVIHGDVT